MVRCKTSLAFCFIPIQRKFVILTQIGMLCKLTNEINDNVSQELCATFLRREKAAATVVHKNLSYLTSI